ncbi:probable magnesium transporter NIPA4 isoform X2 [Abrus precatorius]|uniref:Probable magnesium transporter n=1 Tax=Abrus precatorius TaxID=3816 RepID=A0A8B8JJS9_ABRPR|nr:probable magnesium transporter NIPA4 isoform X2 [Abrus precatorius]
MGLSKENMKGLILALISSGFIGASFIIKKQGLRRAAAVSGVRAGVGGYYYLLEPLWWVGMTTREIANFVAYAFAPAVLVTPLGALSIIVSAVLADFILKEKLHNLGILGCVMCIAGSVIIVIHAPREQPIKCVLEIWNMATQPAFLAYVGSVIVLVFILVFHFAPRCGHTNVLVFTGICSLMGSLSVMSVKALGTSLKLTFEGKNQLTYPETWFFLLVVAICVIMQMNYLNKALDTFNTAIVSPIYYVMFTTLTVLASVIMFKDWDGQSGGTIVSEICGFIVVLSGTIMLHATKDFERSPSFRGMKNLIIPLRSAATDLPDYYIISCDLYVEIIAGSGPSSPSLSVRLYNGNGDFLLKQDEENVSPESMCSRRQELY